MRRFAKLITNNLPLKLVSVIVAIVIWYLVVYNNDPVQTNEYQVPIQVVNESYIANGKQQYVIDEEYKSVVVYVTGNRSELARVDESDIEVTADFTQIVDLNRDPVVVPLSVSLDGFDATDLELSRTTIPIVIENVASKELIVTASTGDSVPDKDYEVGKLTPNQSTVTIYGPESIINNIDSVIAEVNIEGLSHDADVDATLVFIDKDQNTISDSVIESDITFDGGEPEISVSVELWKKKSDIQLGVNYTGTPADGFMISSIVTTPDNITIAGTDEALAKIKQNNNTINIPADYIDVTGLSADTQIEIDLTEILPTDTMITSSTSSSLIVNIAVLPVGSTEYSLDVDNIEVNNLNSAYTVSYDKQEVTIRISGTLNDIYNLTSSSVKASIDLKGYKTGDFTVPLAVELPDGCSLVEDATISIHIKETIDKN